MRGLLVAIGLVLASPAWGEEVFVGAGDIGVCGRENDEKTAALLDNIPGTVFALGDNVYERGTAEEFTNCYEQSWGRHKARTRPATGNHEYLSANAQPYLDYFGVARNYSFDLGDWHIISLDSMCDLPANGGCGDGSPGMEWLKADLAANPRACTLVFFHHPRWSSNVGNGGVAKMAAAWRIMYAAGVDVVLSAHSHSYERLAPLNPKGIVDAVRGIRSFVVGTGGAGLKRFTKTRRGSEVRNADTHGVLKLTLRESDYSWQFIPVAGKTFTDQGSGNCH